MYENNGTSTPEQKKASDFLARLSQAAIDQDAFEEFLIDFGGAIRASSSALINGYEQKVRSYIVNVEVLGGL